MIEIVIPEQHYEPFDEIKEEFLPNIDIKETKIQLEHSLISLRKWEQKWHKPYFADNDKTHEEMIDYIRCMTINRDVDPIVYNWIPANIYDKIIAYMKDPMTATWFNDDLIGAQKSKEQIITAEIIYYWMITLNVPIEFEKWHLNQLLTLIKVINCKNEKPKKVDSATAARQRAALNAKRRAQYKSKG